MKIYDLSVTISEELPVYNGDPKIEIKPHCSIANGSAANVDCVTFGSHTGTHADTPKHFIDVGQTCEDIPLDRFWGPARVLDLRHVLKNRRAVEASDLIPYNIKPGEIILLNLGNSHLLREKTFRSDYISVSANAAEYLADKKIKTIGVDCLSIEAGGDILFPVHHTLLGGGITILEGLLFENEFVPQDSYILSALPLKLKNGNGSPVRAALMSDFFPKAVLFDMDGLLLDTEPLSRDAWRMAAREHGYDMTDEIIGSITGTTRSGAKERLLKTFGSDFDFDTVSALRGRHVETLKKQRGVTVKKGVVNLLNLLDEKRVPYCVATSTKRERAYNLLKEAGLESRFKKIIGGDSITNGKPDPEIFLKAAEEMDASPADCLALEDSRLGAQAAFNGGIRVIVVPDIQLPDAETYARAYAVCESLDDAAALITRQTSAY